MSKKENCGILVYFKGTVQGVGFRFTAQKTARNFLITGYVKNLPDGRVEAKIEGSKDEIEKYLEVLTQRMAAYINEVTKKDYTPEGKYNSFVIEC
ncbi:MAG: acylphosphatase [Planctomycetota bacterium]